MAQNKKSKYNKNNNKNKISKNINKKSGSNKIIKDKLIPLAIIAGIILITSFILIGLLFTAILVIGIVLIIVASFIINKLRRSKISHRITNAIIIIILVMAILGTIGAGIFCLYIVKNAPEFDISKLTYSESTIVYDKDGGIIAELGTEKREIITYDQMSEVLVDAIVATEDSRFFQHNGFDAARFIKASLGQAIGRAGAGGASTLSMQVIKNSFTSKEASGFKGIVRKFTDIYLSVFKLEKNYTKQEIIEFYANNHFLGNNSYGVEQAAKTYFGKTAAQLNLAEASLIVGLFKAPTKYNPFINPEAAAERRNTVLTLMCNHGYITKEEKDLANSIPVESLLATVSNEKLEFQGYIDTVVEELDKKYDVNPYNTPMLIYTNMDRKKQKAVNDIFNGKTFKWENSYIQAGMAAVEVNTGKLVAVGTGRNREGISSYNFATQINRQIGSTSKPIIDYAPGMEYLDWSTATIFSDKPYSYSDGTSLKNSDGGYMGNITIRTALEQSRNIPALKAFQAVRTKIGLDEYKKFIESFGIETESYLHEAHSIGSFNGDKSNPLYMAAAYSPFANGGYYYEPYSVNKIVYRDTGETIEYESDKKQIISDSTAYMITDCLVSAVQYGLSSGAKINGYTIAAKTGTTNYDEKTIKKYSLPRDAVPDSWIVGYDSEISIGLWYGCEKAEKGKYLGVLNSVLEKGKLFRAIAKNVLKKGNKFTMPKSVVKVKIEKGSNPPKLASDSTPAKQIKTEYFKAGTEPTEVSVKYSKLKNVSGLTVNYNASSLSVELNWSGVVDTNKGDKSTYGAFGYKIYKDGKLISFTTDTNYTILNISDPNGTYKVVTTYKNYGDNASSGTSYKYASTVENVLTANLKYSESIYEIGNTLATYDNAPSNNDVIVYYNSEDVTNSASITITIKNSANEIISTISTSQKDVYTINYNISYLGQNITLSRTIKIG